ncbi:MAG: squalene/phytoene synthase family protein, partial [Planctomycetaceae bacterium]|nr:squalene/phytoene synthase family protein [Planctomycetaceae bacterium]
CGLAFQWTNILRDIVEDRERGRVYLPAESFHASGCDVQDLVAGRIGSCFDNLAAMEVSRASSWFSEAMHLDSMLSVDGKRVFRAMFGVYRELLRSIEDNGASIFFQRVRTPKWRLPFIGVYSVFMGLR